MKNYINWNFDNSYSKLPEAFKEIIKPVSVLNPELVILNEDLAKELGLDFSKIDKNLSNKEGLVIRTPEGTTEIHYRGSQILDKPSLSDMKTNFKIATGFESEDPQFLQAKQQYQNAVNEYGSVEHFGGFSKGGGKAIYMGQKYDVPSTTFNPFIGTKTARGITNTTQEHTIIRTTGDSPSLALAVSSNAAIMGNLDVNFRILVRRHTV